MPNVSVKIYYFGAFLLGFLSYVKKKQYLCGAFIAAQAHTCIYVRELTRLQKRKLMNNEVVKYEQVKDKVIILRGEPVLLDADVAALYGVETKRVNEAIKKNPEKFPEGFLFKLDRHETANLRSKLLISSAQCVNNQEVTDLRSKKTTATPQDAENQGGSAYLLLHRNQYTPTAFTERGLYMLATILKSKRATQTTIAIIETFVQLREMARTMQAAAMAEDAQEKKSLMQKSGELIGNIIGSQFETVGTETEIELNLAMVKIRHKVIRGNKDEK